MRSRGVTLRPDDTLARAAELMDALTVRDLAPHRGHFEWTRVRTAMTPDPVTVASHTPARSDLLRLLVAGG